MSQKVFLHVGLPRSDSSYVGCVLTENKQRLMDEAGLLFPGESWHDQVQAVRDVRELGPRLDTAGAWDRLVQEIRDWPGNAVISVEWLCTAEPPHIRRIFEDLEPATVEVVFTARDVGRTLPAAWQEFVQNRHEWTWAEFIEGVAADDPHADSSGGAFWTQQDLAGLVGNWARLAPAERTHVVTVPHRGAPHGLLWNRLAEVFGIAPEGYVTEGLGSNESLGLESAELLRRLNPMTREAGVRRGPYNEIYQHGLARDVLAPRQGSEATLTLPTRYHSWARRTAQGHIDALRASDVRVVGDLAELEPVVDPAATAEPTTVSDADLLAPALAGLLGLGRGWQLSRQREAELETEVERLRRRLARAQRRANTLSGRVRRLSRRVTVLSGQVQGFEATPLRAALRMRARSLGRT